MLSAIPSHVPCVGTEIDPALAFHAQANTGRMVLCGNALNVELPRINAVFGNPPFILSFFEKLMARCAGLLRIGDKAGFIIPAYFFQTSRTTMDLSKSWGVYQEIIPRNLFPRLTKPLLFATFVRDTRSRLYGFRLFGEMEAMRSLSDQFQADLINADGQRGVWKKAVGGVMTKMGGKASLEAIYAGIETNRPTPNKFWKEKVRQICQQEYKRVEKGVYAVN
jgi:site-specific DNA-methyltransferase (adenine-specific)